jgi:hypothetical protein
VDEGTGGSVETPWVADPSEEEDDWEAYVEQQGVITQEALGLGVAHAGTSPATPVRDAMPAVATADTAATDAATAAAAATAAVTDADASTAAAAAGVRAAVTTTTPPLRGNRAVCSNIFCERQ